jgi:hypothetical protein
LRSKWAQELAIAYGPWALLIVMALLGVFTHSAAALGLALALAGGGLLYKQLLRYPMHADQPAAEITSLLGRLDAGPVAAIPTEVRGRIIGRGTPGYLLSPDMVVQDQSGFVPLVWRQPVPLARAWFGLNKIRAYLGQDVVAQGWYRRTPGPVIELREVHAADGRSSKTWWWAACYAASAAVLAVGLIVALVGIAVG